MNMNQRIRHYIKSNGIKFTFVANESGIDIKKFSRMMNNKQRIDTDEYEKICMGLSLEPSFFYQENFLETKNLSKKNKTA